MWAHSSCASASNFSGGRKRESQLGEGFKVRRKKRVKILTLGFTPLHPASVKKCNLIF